jgi:Zn finger protein HypA/HybF involved in hydrogenase expression
MTKQSAIETLEIFRNDYTREGSAICRAIDIAIDALRQHTIDPEVRLIDANALHAKIYEDSERSYGASANIAQVLLRIETAPTIEAKPVRYGRWLNTDETVWDAKEIDGKQKLEISIVAARCSVCERWAEHVNNFSPYMKYNFCPHCGARMDATDTNAGGKGGNG